MTIGEVVDEPMVNSTLDEGWEESNRRLNALVSYNLLRNMFTGLFLIDLKHDRFEHLSLTDDDERVDTEISHESYTGHMNAYGSIFVHPADRARFRSDLSIEHIKQSFSQNKPIACTYRRIYGDSFGYERMYVIFVKEDPDLAILIQRNVTVEVTDENRQMALVQDALELAQNAIQEKDTFMANMSHDLRTPMNAIIGFADMAKRHIDDRERVEDCLDKITLSSNHLVSLINDIVDVSRIEGGKIELEEAPLSISNLMRDLASIFQASIEQRKIDFTVDYENIENDDIYGDALRLNQIFMNIVGNAMKFTRPGGSVHIRAEQIEPAYKGKAAYRFTFEDSGRGMSPEFLKKLWLPFEREVLPHENIEGTGLGMTITKNLVELMGGTIDVESEVGRGTRFTLELAFRVHNTRNERGSNADGSALRDVALDGASQRVLVVDDDMLSREIVGELLREHGFTVEEAEDGVEAVETFENSPEGYYQFILMDVRMPRKSGYDATREIRAFEREDAKTIPIIATTADALEEDQKKALANGMTAHLSKPLNIHDLLTLLKGEAAL